MSVWNWMQRFGSDPVHKLRRVSAFIVDDFLSKTDRMETLLSVDCHQTSTAFYTRNLLVKGERRNMLVAVQFIESFVQKYGRHPDYSDGITWYPEACSVLGLKLSALTV